MQKKFFAWLIVTTLLIGVPALNLNAATGGFTDIGTHWARPLVEKFTQQNILSGFPDGTFRPDNHLQRAEAVVLLNKFFNISEGGYPTFTDVRPTDWHYHHIGSAQRNGYVAGFPDGTFRPTDNVMRLHAFIMIYRLLNEPEITNGADLTQFADYNAIPADNPQFRQIVSYMVGNGIVNAYPDRTLRVTTCVTRAEMLSLLNKASEMITNGNQVLEEPTTSPTEPRYEYNETPAPTPTPGPAANEGGATVLPPRPPGASHWTTGPALIASPPAVRTTPRGLWATG